MLVAAAAPLNEYEGMSTRFKATFSAATRAVTQGMRRWRSWAMRT
jgi:hypothetical protein